MKITTLRTGAVEISLSAWEKKTLDDAVKVLRAMERHAGTEPGVADKVEEARKEVAGE